MAVFKPFRALRPAKEYAVETLCPPYDVVTREEAAEICSANAHSFMHVVRADGDYPQESQYSEKIYAAARQKMDDFEEQGILKQDAAPQYYIYSQTMNERTQTGIVGCASIDDYENGIVKRHEVTREDKEVDRIKHFDSCDANTEPVFLIYRDTEAMKQLTDSIVEAKAPEYDTVDSEGVRHRLWPVEDGGAIAEYERLFEQTEALYIADGHHRTASAVKVGHKRRDEHPDFDGTEEFNRFMAVALPDDQLQVLDYNRLIKDLNGHDKYEFLRMVSELFIVSCDGSADKLPSEKHSCTMYLDGCWYTLKFKDPILDENNPVSSLDVSILQETLLGPVLGIKDPRTDTRISFVGGIKGPQELKRRVDSGEMAVAFALYPVSVHEIMNVADAGLVMPPKSTWFEPKLGSGWFIHKL